jgi:hypothetical protein
VVSTNSNQVIAIFGDAKGAKLTFNSLRYSITSARRLHRQRGVREIASLQSSRNPGPESGETAPKRRIRIGVLTETASLFNRAMAH